MQKILVGLVVGLLLLGLASPAMAGFLGVSVVPDDNIRAARVTGVTSNSPASASGLAVGDLIFKINDADVENGDQLTAALQNAGTVTIRFLRNGQQFEIDNLSLPDGITPAFKKAGVPNKARARLSTKKVTPPGRRRPAPPKRP